MSFCRVFFLCADDLQIVDDNHRLFSAAKFYELFYDSPDFRYRAIKNRTVADLAGLNDIEVLKLFVSRFFYGFQQLFIRLFGDIIENDDTYNEIYDNYYGNE